MIEIDTENLLNIVNVEIPEKMKIQNLQYDNFQLLLPTDLVHVKCRLVSANRQSLVGLQGSISCMFEIKHAYDHEFKRVNIILHRSLGFPDHFQVVCFLFVPY